jgi:hypothetical protein
VKGKEQKLGKGLPTRPMNMVTNRIVFLSLALVLNAGQQQPAADLNGGARVRNLVHDPKITENSPGLSSIPRDTPHSEWTVNDSTYVIVYRNEDKSDPFDIIADIYYRGSQNMKLRKLLTVSVSAEVEDVRLLNIKGDSESQIGFFCKSGQQDWLIIVGLEGPSARKLFEYGARWIKLTEDKPPKILAHSHPDDTTEVFMWCKTKQKIVLESACGQKH